MAKYWRHLGSFDTKLTLVYYSTESQNKKLVKLLNFLHPITKVSNLPIKVIFCPHLIDIKTLSKQHYRNFLFKKDNNALKTSKKTELFCKR